MKKSYFILIILSLLTCKRSNDNKSLMESLSIFFLNANRISISGQAVKGIIRNGNVDITPMNSKGTCDRGNVLTTADTDDSGNYSVKYNKTGKIVCVIVSGSTSVASTMYDEKTKADVPVPSNFELVNFVSEASILESKKRNSTISLFSKMMSGRLKTLHESNTANSSSNALLRKASKEVVIRFGLNSGIGAISGKSNLTKEAESKNIKDSDFPEYNEINFDFSDPTNPLASKFIAVSGGFSHLANKYKKSAKTNSEDIDSVINAFASDFEDGLFDGKTIKGESITLGTGTNKITFGSTPLTSILYPAILAYFEEGGVLSIGAPTRPGTTAIAPSTLSTTQLGSIQFIDNAPIIAVAAPGETALGPAPATPIFSPTPGHYNTAQPNITITTATAGATIYYTTNGSTPTTASTVYTTGLGHIWLNAGRPIKAIAVKSGSTDSPVVTAEYSYPPLKTGQTLCYNATIAIGCPGLGGDGATQLGVARSYTDNGNSTVTDNATGLHWQKCSNGLSDGSCGTGTLQTPDWATAQTNCSALTTAGKTWRLPSVIELETLHDYGVATPPSINQAVFPATVADRYWSSTTYAPNTMMAWFVNFTLSQLSAIVKTTNYRVRCVSGDAKPTTQTFTDIGDGTVKDNQTGLVWQKCSVGQTGGACAGGAASTQDWATALTTCSALGLAGKTWRLPSAMELSSIVDKTLATMPNINTTVFPATADGHWSSTTYAPIPANAGIVGFNDGIFINNTKTLANYRVRCVSGP